MKYKFSSHSCEECTHLRVVYEGDLIYLFFGNT